MGAFAGTQAGCIITTYFDIACSQGRRTVIITHDLHLYRIKTLLEVGTNRAHKDHEHIFFGCLHANLGTRTYKQRPDVQGRAFAVRRNILQVEFNRLENNFGEKFYRYFSHHHPLC